MIQNNTLAVQPAITYPESDGLPLADNTRQMCWIFLLYGNLSGLFHDRSVFVAGNNLWYPVEGHPEICIAPDVYVVFDRPKGHRPSYQQWNEGNVPLTVAFEVLSPGNTVMEMANKLLFYDEYGVKEYYVYDPDTNGFLAYLRVGETLLRQRVKDSFVSPLLGIRFDLTGPEMKVFHPDGQPFLSFEEVDLARAAEKQLRLEAQLLAEQAQRTVEQAQRTVEQVQHRAARMVELGRKARRNLATPEEIAELERLENES
jgi:Uma2 family endonuclease